MGCPVTVWSTTARGIEFTRSLRPCGLSLVPNAALCQKHDDDRIRLNHGESNTLGGGERGTIDTHENKRPRGSLRQQRATDPGPKPNTGGPA